MIPATTSRPKKVRKSERSLPAPPKGILNKESQEKHRLGAKLLTARNKHVTLTIQYTRLTHYLQFIYIYEYHLIN